MTDSNTPLVLLQAEKLCKTYPDGSVHALVDVDITVRVGEYVAIMGPSGSGKSTLLSLLGTLDVPTAGRVLLEGTPITAWGSLDRLRSRRIGFVFQSFYLLPTLTALENVQIPMFGTGKTAIQRRDKAAELLAAVGLTDRATHLPKNLSVGQRQRVAIARALANDPILLLADEPTGNLDSKSAEEVLDLFEKLHRERDMTILMVTHSDDVARRAQRVILVKDGRVVQDSLAA